MLRCWEDVYAHLVTHVVNNRAVSGDACGRFASKGNSIAGEESDGTPGTPSSVYLRVNRRRTDLMPTIPSPRDGPPTSGRSSSAKAFTRSPGRTYSMSRLDQLAQPRKRPTELSTLTEQQSQPLSASSMSRSMSHLAASGGKSLKRSDNSRSMGTLPGAVPMPRPTRAERLRRKAREHQNQQQQGKIVLVHSTRWYFLSLSFNEILLMYRYDIVHHRRDLNHWISPIDVSFALNTIAVTTSWTVTIRFISRLTSTLSPPFHPRFHDSRFHSYLESEMGI